MAPALSFAASNIHHDLDVSLNPDNHEINVIDKITFPDELLNDSEIVFYLHESLILNSNTKQIKTISHSRRFPVPVRAYRLSLDKGQPSVVINYSGQLNHELTSQGEQSVKGFSETAGMISADGVFLAGSSIWYPYVDATQVSFSMKVKSPSGWKVVSQGDRLNQTNGEQVNSVLWQELNPQEEIYLIAAPFHEYSKAVGKVETMAFLRQADTALANKYLEVTAQYIEMYRQLLGPYPYNKFALVENFWETGYGMPSFTLLGPKVIRMPFILHSSYPHEILHNWWGNGVYVDYQQGNWAEGLTSYLADHLIQQQRGKAVNFRRNILQNYADFVSDSRDFPLAEFTSRHSSSSEAIGYGKSQMFFHMLRQMLGDEAFVIGLHRFYRQYKFKEAGFDDLLQVFQAVSKDDLAPFFQQWVRRSGAPALQLDDVSVDKVEDSWLLRGMLKQVQEGDAYQLTVPVVVTLEGKAEAHQINLLLADKQQTFSISLPAKPVRLDVDPGFDLFRRVSRAEIPPALSQAFGAERVLIVLPTRAPVETRAAYEALVRNWGNSLFANLEVTYDDVLTVLPDDRTVWLLGGNNLFASKVVDALKDQGVVHQGQEIRLKEGVFNPAQHSIVLTARRHNNDSNAMVWLAADRPQAIPGLGRKLPHYRKYSYLVFEGDAPTINVKNQWPVMQSPMSVRLDGAATNMARLAVAPALAQLPAVFDQQRMLADIRALTTPEMAGRVLGTQGLDNAAQYIANAFRDAGLKAGYPDTGSFIQQWTGHVAELGRDVLMKNVVGYIPGRNPAMAGQSVVIGANFDSFGLNRPSLSDSGQNSSNPAADDVSGVAVMLELARLAARGWQPQRSIVFVAFTSAGAARLGSEHFVSQYHQFPAEKAIAMVNLDAVGYLDNAPVAVFGSGSASEWKHIFRGIGFVTGLKVKTMGNDLGSGGHRSYLEMGIPAVQLSGSADIPKKIDLAGMVKVASVLKETIFYLSGRTGFLTVKTPGLND